MAAVLERVAEFEAELAGLQAKKNEVLQKLVGLLRGFSATEDDAAFCSLLKDAQAVLEIDDDELADALRVNRSTISRWTRAVTAPHAVMQESILKVVARLVEGKLRQRKSH